MSVAGFTGAGDGGGSGLASHAAQIGFARGAQMQQQQLLQTHDGRLALETKAGAVKTRIRDVWKHNLAQEMAVLRQLVEKYPYISMVWLPRDGNDLGFDSGAEVLMPRAGYRVPWHCRSSHRIIYE